MTPWEVITRLYGSEINSGLQADWDAGITAWIGDDFNGRRVQATFTRDEFDRIAEWLDFEARRLYPDSQYTKGRSA
jgi:hypothetical protein